MAGRGTVVLGEGLWSWVVCTSSHRATRADELTISFEAVPADKEIRLFRFYVALGDDLMRLFGSERVSEMMERLGWEDESRLTQIHQQCRENSKEG